MDALKGFVVWPLYIAITYLVFWLAIVLNLPFIILRILSKGLRSLSKVSSMYEFFSPLPLGKYIISGIVSVYAPYSSSVGAYIENLSTNSCTVILSDYPWLRNPFQSLHAVALINVGEMASGICMVSQLEINKHIKGIPTKISTEFFKKARGNITAVGTVDLKV